MEVIKKRVKVNKEGIINIELSTVLPEGEVDIVVVLENNEPKPSDITRFIGTLNSFQEDPVAYQKKIRDEWQ